jgi:nanoRNase/pAp phosphatase (c-di-AMP/oligoRNAs hydrolase)
MKMIKIIYHANCTDGFCAAFLFWLIHKDNAEYIPFHYAVELDLTQFSITDEVYIVDFSFNYETLLDLSHIVKKVVVLDHHKTAEEELGNREWPDNVNVIFNMDKSGAMLAWEYLHPESYPLSLIRYVQDRDLWRFKLAYSKEVSAYLQALPFDFEKFDEVYNHFTQDIQKYIAYGYAILMKLNQQIDLAVSNAIRMRLGKHKIWAVNSTVNFSEVAGQLAEKGDFGVAWFVRSDGKYQYSLRSKGFDVSKVAKSYGGGGHQQAAGFESDEQVLKKIPNLIGKILQRSDGSYIRIFGYDPTGVNIHVKGTHVPHYKVHACDEHGVLTSTAFDIPEEEIGCND